MKVRDAIKLIERDGFEATIGFMFTRRSLGSSLSRDILAPMSRPALFRDTREEMDRNIRAAIELYLDELREQGLPTPVPTTDTEYIAV